MFALAFSCAPSSLLRAACSCAPTGGQMPISSTRSAASSATPVLAAHLASASLQVVALDMASLLLDRQGRTQRLCQWRQRPCLAHAQVLAAYRRSLMANIALFTSVAHAAAAAANLSCWAARQARPGGAGELSDRVDWETVIFGLSNGVHIACDRGSFGSRRKKRSRRRSRRVVDLVSHPRLSSELEKWQQTAV